jgi:multidrug resistance protein
MGETQSSTDVEKAQNFQNAPTAELAAATVPEVPYTIFSHRVKIFIIIMSAISSLFSPVSSLIYLPALDVLADFYHVSVGRINLSVTTYMILQGLAPMFFSDMADQMGRRPVYILTLCIYLVANIALALQSNYAALLVLRAVQSMGSSGTIALGNAVMADIATPAERSGYISYVQAGMMVGPAIAPTIGGLLTQSLGWRAMFWFLVIACGVYMTIYIPFLPETCRKVVENGSIPPQSWNRTVWNSIEKRSNRRKEAGDTTDELERQQRRYELATNRRLAIPNPLKALRIIVEKDVALIMLFTSLMVAGFYMIMVPIPSVFGNVYKFNQLQVGLCYMYVLPPISHLKLF